MIDESRRVAFHRRIHDEIIVNAEHVATDAFGIVVFFTFIS